MFWAVVDIADPVIARWSDPQQPPGAALPCSGAAYSTWPSSSPSLSACGRDFHDQQYLPPCCSNISSLPLMSALQRRNWRGNRDRVGWHLESLFSIMVWPAFIGVDC